ncbi:MAG: FecR domain-containing protein [Methylotenera sp.]|nr:FecR domain-containing protein [Oligoflexia bacterium]
MKNVCKWICGGTSVLFFSLGIGQTAALAAETAGKAVSVSGKVLVRNEADKIPQMKFLKSGDEISAGTILNTGSTGAVKLLMTDKSIIDLGPSTLFKMDDYQLNGGGDRKVTMSMDYGKMRASVNTPVGAKGKYQVRTRAATMGVRGTEFIVASDLPSSGQATQITPPGGAGAADGKKSPDGKTAQLATAQTQITVVHGIVEVKDEQKPRAPLVALKVGGQLTTANEQGRAAKVIQLSTADLTTVRQAAIQKDVTFLQAVTVDHSGAPGSSGSATLARLSESFAAMPKNAIPTIGNLGLPGTFGADSSMFNRPNRTFVGRPVTLRVIFKN